ncbi:hypothetical protein UFOVP26_54 [uncultured Caudovirales phage]|uniref:Uncharacterized protein n=1 Tax=uncultured Caudovirales phage TaxID=2100421 RepID=A0A6J5KN35_9CAUD|nr:hypothetical protein UFOVP26_54 [uncultured Caudovirales phage]CAB4123728.1 hypothetical protein UFOVP44_43 [uncultured Caudovirales phage]CAB5219117.1 hypothetical protein UFOVP220_34 [uncultured Caudovirales phage]
MRNRYFTDDAALMMIGIYLAIFVGVYLGVTL